MVEPPVVIRRRFQHRLQIMFNYYLNEKKNKNILHIRIYKKRRKIKNSAH